MCNNVYMCVCSLHLQRIYGHFLNNSRICAFTLASKGIACRAFAFPNCIKSHSRQFQQQNNNTNTNSNSNNILHRTLQASHTFRLHRSLNQPTDSECDCCLGQLNFLKKLRHIHFEKLWIYKQMYANDRVRVKDLR